MGTRVVSGSVCVVTGFVTRNNWFNATSNLGFQRSFVIITLSTRSDYSSPGKAKEVFFLGPEFVYAETITEVGDPKEAICKAVEKLNIQFLVLDSHGRGAFGRAFLGSVSNYWSHNAKCPVLVVRKPE
ncbi:hypothetical protein CK203_011816 [Vitis vinifera]|uniref:UspA domain-containing protein n=1 Tax=Vitis vinifera TaxID=29760 RepID=A0A438JU66_VITVI|nr:hypothetical protein CK203_011816 [Vitis vinifera]